MKHKYLGFVFFASILYASAFPQPSVKHQRTIGGDSSDVLFSIYLTNDGGLIAGGDSYSDISYEKTENSRGFSDFWIVKLDSLGKIEWDKTIGGSDYENLNSLQQTSDGGYILGGSSASDISGEKTESSRGGSDYWVVKLDRKGKIQWNRTIGGSNNEYLLSLQQTKDNGYILGGWSTSNISGEKTENSRGSEDYWVVKIDRFGKIQWDKTIGGSRMDILTCVQQTCDGDYILGGYSESSISGEKTENSRGYDDY